MTNRTLVVSIDALITADIPVLKQLPNLGRVMEHASWITDIECIYPTLTYPCHATIATGCWPDRTGINNNEIPDFFAKGRMDWYWWREAIQVPTVVDFARQAGLTASTVTWPVMCASGAEYNIGEIWAPREEDDPTPWFTRANSPAVAKIFEANKHMLRWMKIPPSGRPLWCPATAKAAWRCWRTQASCAPAVEWSTLGPPLSRSWKASLYFPTSWSHAANSASLCAPKGAAKEPASLAVPARWS
mgnify:CR=1 FL=1